MKFYTFTSFVALLSLLAFSNLNAQSIDCTALPTWSATTTYSTTGTRVVYSGVVYHNNFWTQNDNPSTHNGGAGSGAAWTSEGNCSGTTGSTGSGTSWDVQGNTITVGQFIGTINNQALVLKANNLEGLYVNPEKGAISIGSKSVYPFYYRFEVNNGLSAFTGPNQANQNNLMTLYSGNQSTAKYGQGYRHYIGFSHALFPNGEEFGVMNTYEYNATSGAGAGKHMLIQNTNEGNLGIGVMTNPPAEKLSVNGNVQVGINPVAYGTEGNRLYLGTSFDNTDPVYLARFNTASDKTTTRICIGDNSDNLDVLEVGSMPTGGGQWIPAIRVGANGTIAAKEVCVNLTLAWCDYVFEEDYKLMSLKELKTFIQKHKHLPEIPSTKEMEKTGLNLNQMVTLQMKKIEELTLYTIDQDKKIEDQQLQIKQFEERLLKLEELYSKLK